MVYPHFSGHVYPYAPWSIQAVPQQRVAWPFQSSVPAKPFEGPVKPVGPRKGG